jgi:hypothetical protein
LPANGGGNWFVLARQTSEERRKVQITEEGEIYQQKLQWPPNLRVQPTSLRSQDAVAILAPRKLGLPASAASASQ